MIEKSKKNHDRYIWNPVKNEISLPDTKTGKYFVLKTDKYKLLDKIGEGANGVVIKALNTTLNRIEAIKIWLPNRTKKNKIANFNQYLAEIQKLANINKNNNIVTMYDAWTQDDYYFASTEFVEGKNLEKWLINATEIERKEICCQLLETILCYQSSGIIHGDIHSGNILIDKKNQIHLIDFGTSYFTRNKNACRVSIDREINLIYEDIKLILGNSFRDDFLSLDFNIDDSKRKINTDNINPILFTKTLLQLCKIICIKENAEIIIDYEVLREYCSYAAAGFYLNLNNIINDLKSWSSLKNIETLSISYLTGIIQNNIFTDYCSICDLIPGKKFDENEIEAVSAYVYYELSKKLFSKENYNRTKTEYFEHYKNFLDENSFKNLWDILKSFENDSLFELIKTNFQNNALFVFDLENIRSVLSTLLNICYRPLDYYPLLWLKITETRLNKELHDRIMDEIAVDYSSF